MSEQRVRFEGVSCTDEYVTVYFTIGDRLAKRVREVKITPEALLDAEVMVPINRAAVKRLKVIWEDRQETLPWD